MNVFTPRFDGVDPRFPRLRPHRGIAWGVEVSSTEDRSAHGRDV